MKESFEKMYEQSFGSKTAFVINSKKKDHKKVNRSFETDGKLSLITRDF